jgi:hypothetical protein
MNQSHFNQTAPPLPSTHSDSRLILTPIQLAASLPKPFATPKFQIGQTVVWARVPSHGYGTIVGLSHAHSISVVAHGYHYLIALDDNSPSRSDCAADWAFEDDLELLVTHAHLLQG